MSDGEQQIDVLRGGEALAAMVRSEVDIQIATAKAYPRDMKKVSDRVRDLVIADPQIAKACWYRLERFDKRSGTKKIIEGPSIRFAEIIASQYGNIRTGRRIIAIEEKAIVAQGVAFDLESNFMNTAEVRRSIVGASGGRFSEDMIGVTCAAAAAIAFRNAVQQLIPRAVFRSVYERCYQTAFGDKKSIAEAWTEVCKFFGAQGVPVEAVMRKAEITDVTQLTVDKLRILIEIRTAIEEGHDTAAEAFGVAPAPTAASAAAPDPLADGKHKVAPKKGAANPAPAAKAEAPAPQGNPVAAAQSRIIDFVSGIFRLADEAEEERPATRDRVIAATGMTEDQLRAAARDVLSITDPAALLDAEKRAAGAYQFAAMRRKELA